MMLLLCFGLVKSGMTEPLSVPTQKKPVRLEWGETNYKIYYTKNGVEKVLQGRHGVPNHDAMVPNAPRRKRATDPNALITTENMNYRLLDSLQWRECNRYRSTLGLPPVEWDDQIYRASSHHSFYMQFFVDLTHDENQEITYRAEDQAHYQSVFAGAAEICLYNWAHLGGDTYKEVAAYCIEQWRNSPGHNAIMIDKSYKYNSFGACLMYSGKNRITREALAAYNPRLLETIERECPEVFDLVPETKSVQVWSTGNFRWSRPKVQPTPGQSTTTLSGTSATPSSTAANTVNTDATEPEIVRADDVEEDKTNYTYQANHRTPTRTTSNTRSAREKRSNHYTTKRRKKRRKQSTFGRKLEYWMSNHTFKRKHKKRRNRYRR